jgi:hypothetical protein
MKVTFRPYGAVDESTDWVLADGSDRADDNARGPVSGSVSVSLSLQEFKAIRAAATQFISRDNRAGSWTFRASRRFASIPDASRFMLTHGMDMPSAGTLICEWDLNYSVILTGAVVRQVGELSQIGVHVNTAYSVSYSGASVLPITTIRINCGGPTTGLWIADTGLYTGSGGTSSTTSAILNHTASGVPEAVMQTLRWGTNLVYTFAVPDGRYDVTCYFAETAYTAIGARVFHVEINGRRAPSNLDILARTDSRQFYTLRWVTSGELVEGGGGIALEFINVTGGAMCCGIQIAPSVPTLRGDAPAEIESAPVVRKINCGGWAAEDGWEADVGFSGDNAAGSSAAEVTGAGTVPQAVYQAYRAGADITYEIPLAAGFYDLRLHFADVVEATETRLFDVAVNGVLQFEDLAPLTLAGGANAAHVAGVDAIEVVDSLTIVITANDGLAILNGIEIVPHEAEPDPIEE